MSLSSPELPQHHFDDGFQLPLIGLGTWTFGGRTTRDLNNDDDRDMAAIEAAIQLGITHFDTAELYAAGYAETLLGRVISQRERARFVIASKVWKTNLAYDAVLKACDASLERLQTDYLDIYYIHWPNDAFPIGETMRALTRLVDQGLVRAIGMSNFTKERLAAAQAATPHSIRINQVQYNLRYRAPEELGLLEYAQSRNIVTLAWRALQLGEFAKDEVEPLRRLAAKYQRTPAQIALNWLVCHEKVGFLMTSRNPDHLSENLGALGWRMDSEDFQRLSERFPGKGATPAEPLY